MLRRLALFTLATTCAGLRTTCEEAEPARCDIDAALHWRGCSLLCSRLGTVPGPSAHQHYAYRCARADPSTAPGHARRDTRLAHSRARTYRPTRAAVGHTTF